MRHIKIERVSKSVADMQRLESTEMIWYEMVWYDRSGISKKGSSRNPWIDEWMDRQADRFHQPKSAVYEIFD